MGANCCSVLRLLVSALVSRANLVHPAGDETMKAAYITFITTTVSPGTDQRNKILPQLSVPHEGWWQDHLRRQLLVRNERQYVSLNTNGAPAAAGLVLGRCPLRRDLGEEAR